MSSAKCHACMHASGRATDVCMNQHLCKRIKEVYTLYYSLRRGNVYVHLSALHVKDNTPTRVKHKKGQYNSRMRLFVHIPTDGLGN